MPLCQIQWVDDTGHATPDSNPACAVAVNTIDYRDGNPPSVRRLHICADHLPQLDAMCGTVAVATSVGRVIYYSSWSKESL